MCARDLSGPVNGETVESLVLRKYSGRLLNLLVTSRKGLPDFHCVDGETEVRKVKSLSLGIGRL